MHIFFIKKVFKSLKKYIQSIFFTFDSWNLVLRGIKRWILRWIDIEGDSNKEFYREILNIYRKVVMLPALVFTACFVILIIYYNIFVNYVVFGVLFYYLKWWISCEWMHKVHLSNEFMDYRVFQKKDE